MGLELGDLEEYGFHRSDVCGGNLCLDKRSPEEMAAASLLFFDRFTASVKNSYEVAMCHPYLAPHRPKVEFFLFYNYWPFSWFVGLPWRIYFN